MKLITSKKVYAICALVLLATIIGGVIHYGAKRNTVAIGFVGPLTGPSAFWGEGARNMVMLATEEINARGGIGGKQIEVLYQDGKCSAPDAVAALQNLKARGVKYIIGGECSPETVAMAPLTKDGSAFMLAGITSADGAVSTSDYAFRTSPDTAEVTAIMTPMVAAKYKKIATITEMTAYAKSFTTDFEANAKKAGAQIVAHAEYNPGDTDFRSAIAQFKTSGADVILVSPQSPTAGAQIAKQMHELGVNTQLIGNAVFMTQSVYEKAEKPANMIGAFTILPYADPTAAGAVALQADYKKRFGADVPYNLYYVGSAYDSVNMLVDTIQKCGDDTTCVSGAFKTMTYTGAVGTYGFKENGDMKTYTWSVSSFGADGKIQTDPIK